MQFVRKAEEALTGKKDEAPESTQSSNHGPHSSKLANKLDPRVDSDRDNRAAHTHDSIDDTHIGKSRNFGSGAPTETTAGTTTGTHGHGVTSSSNAGPHSSNLANKMDPRVDSDRDNRARHEAMAGTGTTSSATAGPHSSDLANKADPRVDSDRDNRSRHAGLTGTGPGAGLTSSTHGTHGTTATGVTGSSAGPHNSNLANKVDPRVDSDRDNRARHETIAASGPTSSSTAGPHSSDVTNKLDPRVDSDRDNRARHGPLAGGTGANVGSTHDSHGITPASGLGTSTGTTHGTTGTSYNTPGSSTTNTGPHSSNIANKMDPRVDSDRDNRARHEAIASSGTTTSATGGPHSSDVANKLDPRVDSDRDNRAKHQAAHGTGVGTTATGTHTSALGGSGLGTAGHGDALAGSSYNTPTTGLGGTGTTGATGTTAHSSNIANKLDPRVDSDVTRAQNEGVQRKF